MARNVNVTIENYQATGAQVLVDQYSVDLFIEWIKNDGTPGSVSQTILFPNILGNPAISNQWLKQHLTELMLAALREIAGVDSP